MSTSTGSTLLTTSKLSTSQKGLAPILIVLLIAVAVGSYLFYSNYSNNRNKNGSLQQTTQPPPTPVTTPIASSSAASPAPTGAEESTNWKTYTNQSLGISFQYPKDWVLSNRYSTSVNLYPQSYQEKAVIDILTKLNPDNLSLEDLDKKLTGPSGMGPQLYSPKNNLVQIQSGITAYYGKCVIDGGGPEIIDCEQYIIPYKQKVFQLRNVIHRGIQNQKIIFDQILSTFRFD